ncbi:unnamed protein product, partial [Bubo scandiacus]
GSPTNAWKAELLKVSEQLQQLRLYGNGGRSRMSDSHISLWCWCQKRRMIDGKQPQACRHSSFCFGY